MRNNSGVSGPGKSCEDLKKERERENNAPNRKLELINAGLGEDDGVRWKA